MSDILRYKSPEEMREEEVELKLREKGPEGEPVGGVIFEEELDEETGQMKKYLYFGNPYEEGTTITRLETDATREEVERIKKEMIPMKESFEILGRMATTFKNNEALILEGASAIGKTYLGEKFTELLRGYGTRPLEFYCSGQTDVSELFGRWVPRTESEEERKSWNKFVESEEAQLKLTEIGEEIAQKSGLSESQRMALIHQKIRDIAKTANISEKTQWRFQYGAVPRAMGAVKNPDGSLGVAEKNGAGWILHIEEVGLAEPQVVNALLQLRGKKGKIANSMRIWDYGGKQVDGGPKWWYMMSTNPPEEYGSGREPLDAALIRGSNFARLGDLSKESYDMAADYYMTYRVGENSTKKPDGCIFELSKYPEVGKEIAKVMSQVHTSLNDTLRTTGERGRGTKIILTLDQMASVAGYMLTSQRGHRNKETGRLDITKMIRDVMKFVYFDRLADESLKQRGEAMLTSLLEVEDEKIEALRKSEEVLNPKPGVKLELPPGVVEFEGQLMSRREKIETLVDRYSVTGDEQKETAEREKRELRSAVYANASIIDTKLNSSGVADSTKRILWGNLRNIATRAKELGVLSEDMNDFFKSHAQNLPEGLREDLTDDGNFEHEAVEEEGVLHAVVFEQQQRTSNGKPIIEYFRSGNKETGENRLVLTEGSAIEPKPGIFYKVKVVDQKQRSSGPTEEGEIKGKRIVEILGEDIETFDAGRLQAIREMMEKAKTTDDWEAIHEFYKYIGQNLGEEEARKWGEEVISRDQKFLDQFAPNTSARRSPPPPRPSGGRPRPRRR